MPITLNPGYFNPSIRSADWWRRSVSVILFLFFCTTGFLNKAVASDTKRHFVPAHTEAFPLPPGVPDVTNPLTKLTIIVDNSIANNTSNDQIKAHIVDSDGNPVPAGTNVNFSWNPGTGE